MPVSFLQRGLAWAFRVSKQNRRKKHLRSIESLEQRVVLAATTDAAAIPTFRVTVTSFEYSSTDTDIKAVLENLSTGSSTIIEVATSSLVEREPRVSMDSGGNWAVVWTEVASSGDLNVKAKLYNKSGGLKSGLDAADVINEQGCLLGALLEHWLRSEFSNGRRQRFFTG